MNITAVTIYSKIPKCFNKSTSEILTRPFVMFVRRPKPSGLKVILTGCATT